MRGYAESYGNQNLSTDGKPRTSTKPARNRQRIISAMLKVQCRKKAPGKRMQHSGVPCFTPSGTQDKEGAV